MARRGEHWLWATLWMAASGCAGSAPAPESALQAPTLTRAPVARVADPGERSVAVAGIEGTLTEYEIRTAMQKRLDDLAGCQAQRMHDVPLLAGEIEVAIHVQRDGRVGQVSPRRSSIGDLETERCILDVVRDTRFPRPRGGEADVRWSMHIDVHRGRPADSIPPGRLKYRLSKQVPRLRQSCELDVPRVQVTAYVGRSGQVLAVGASAKEPASDELFDCISDDVKTWRMPKGNRVAKVSFQLP